MLIRRRGTVSADLAREYDSFIRAEWERYSPEVSASAPRREPGIAHPVVTLSVTLDVPEGDPITGADLPLDPV